MSDAAHSFLREPVFFERNRVFRVYRGGRLFHEFFGDPPEDGFFPEEWLASTVKAQNRGAHGENEGLSILRGQRVPFSMLMATHRPQLLGQRESFDLLVKILHSSLRLPVQVHPDKDFALRHFRSAHGKTEMWLVLATEEDARIYFGFKEGVRKRDLIASIRASETQRAAACDLLNEIRVAPGDVILIPGRVAHTIGAGCLILEAEEPTDLMIQVEAWCGDYHLNASEMYMGLDEATALACFDFDTLVGDRAVAAARKLPRTFVEGPSCTGEHLIAPDDTSDFAVNRYHVTAGSFCLQGGPAVYVVTEGKGSFRESAGMTEISKGSYFFLPALANGLTVETSTTLQIVECLPPPLL